MSGLVGDAAAHVVRVTGVRRVIDLRTADEIDSWPASELPAPCARIHAALFDTIQDHWVHPMDRGPAATAERYVEMLEAGSATIVRVLEMLGEAPSGPTVIHCAAGRDRTGIVIACVLDLLGVPDDTIAQDYALTDVVLDDEGGALPETMHRMLELVRTRYGSMRAFLVDGRCAEGTIDRLGTALLEDGPAPAPPAETPPST